MRASERIKRTRKLIKKAGQRECTWSPATQGASHSEKRQRGGGGKKKRGLGQRGRAFKHWEKEKEKRERGETIKGNQKDSYLPTLV